uniref:Uncharacterized protein n=1 Tax=Anguilla anguilla TaxID=7936 RepID=A0A0E9QPU3_ANGAN
MTLKRLTLHARAGSSVLNAYRMWFY